MAETFSLAQKFEIGGYWWLPDKPGETIYGQLQYQPENATELSLEGSFKESLRSAFGIVSPPVIHGKTSNGFLCTLLDVHEKSTTVHSQGITVKSYFCHKLFVGKELLVSDNVLFESALVQFTDFSTWLSRKPFKVERSFAKNNQRVHKICHTMPNLISTPVESIKASIKFESLFTSGGVNQERKLIHCDRIRFRPRSKKNLQWYLDIIHKFRIFLSMLTGEPANPVSIEFCTKRRRLSHSGRKLHREYLDYCSPHYQSRKRSRLHYHEMLFPYPLIKKGFRKHLNSWYAKSDELRTPFQLYFGVLLQADTPLEFRFLALIQAIESYHRLKKVNKYMSDKAYEPIKNAIIHAIPDEVRPDHRDALKSRIKYGNEYSLRRRLTIILALIPRSLREKIINTDSEFINKIVATRNYLTHRDDSDKKNVLDAKGIFHASESLRILLLILFLIEIEIDALKIEHAISTNWKFRSIQKIK